MEPTIFGYLKAKAAYCSTIPGIKKTIYPATGHPKPGEMPCIVLFSQSLLGNSLVDADATGAMLTLQSSGQLLVSNKGDIDKVIEEGDKLVDPILRAFMFNGDGYNPAVDYVNAHAGQVDFISLAQFLTGDITYAGQAYYGANLYFTTKWHIYPGGTP